MSMIDDLNGRGHIALDLPGWDDYSTWGYDSMTDSLFAQLWANTDSSRDDPRHWITPGSARWPATTSVDTMAEYIADAAGVAVDVARQAMARSAPTSVKAHLLGARA